MRFLDDQVLQKSDAGYIHLCQHIMKLLQNNIINLCKTEIETSNNNLGKEYTLNKISIHVFVSSPKKFMKNVLKQSFLMLSSNFLRHIRYLAIA